MEGPGVCSTDEEPSSTSGNAEDDVIADNATSNESSSAAKRFMFSTSSDVSTVFDYIFGIDTASITSSAEDIERGIKRNTLDYSTAKSEEKG